jgi:hypothetical protein
MRNCLACFAYFASSAHKRINNYLASFAVCSASMVVLAVAAKKAKEAKEKTFTPEALHLQGRAAE